MNSIRPSLVTAETMKPLSFEHDEIERSIPERFRKVARACCAQVAVQSGTETLTYGALDSASNRIAHALLGAGGPGEEPVALLCRNDAVLGVALVGVLKAGKAYAALADSLPQSQMESTLHYLQGRILLCDTENAGLAQLLALHTGYKVLVIGRDTDLNSADDPLLEIGPDRLASLTFTSGSTGEPKGVMRSHRLLLQRAWRDLQDLTVGSQDRVAFLYSAAFSASTSVVFGTLLNGAALCLYDFQSSGLESLTAWLLGSKVTCLQLPLELFRQWLDTLAPSTFLPNLRQIAPAGRLLGQDIDRVRPHVAPDCVLIGRLASSETGIIARTIFPVWRAPTEKVLPVGIPVPEMELRIVDETRRQVAEGEIGELLVRGRYLSPGYWRRPDLTEAVFAPDPSRPHEIWYQTGDLVRIKPDGEDQGMLEFHGRRDDRVKVRGYSVELAAVETALLAIGSISAATVTAPASADGERRLVAYVVPAGEMTPTGRHLRHALVESLPAYMIPSVFIVLSALPLTTNGKVDRSALPAPENYRPDADASYVAPRNESEAKVTRIWADVLGYDEIGVNDSFLDLGGHSLLATRILARTVEVFGVEVPLKDFFDASTPAAMAALIDLHQATPGASFERALADVESWSERDAALLVGEFDA